jgi:hypothetical protein
VKVQLQNDVIFIDRHDVPQFKKGGSVVRNNYFWALRSIAGQAYRDRDWEYESEVWLALRRMLLSFAESGYLATSETQLEFPADQDEIPQVLKVVSTRQD